MTELDRILAKLSELIQTGKFEDQETDAIEIKPVPSTGGEWKERHKTANAFLNTRGGLIIFGIREEGTGPSRRYAFQGWRSDAEPKLKEFPKLFTDRLNHPQDLSDRFPPPQLRPFLNGTVAILYVDELPADRKFVYLSRDAFKRILTGDHRISEAEIQAQEQFKAEALHARELQPVPGITLNDLDLTKLNNFIYELNHPVQIETIKPDLPSAITFLQRKSFLKDGAVTILGALVCAAHPGDFLGFRSHVHGYVDLPSQGSGESRTVVQDKQDFVDNVLQLMSDAFGYIQRNIQVGVIASGGGASQSQYPQALLRETVNNALAHRDYAINRQVIIAIVPGRHIAIQNPGTFRPQLLIEYPDHEIPLRRIVPEARPRNPKLADVLRVYRKWEGRGIGMATLVNLCLQNQIGIPYYRLLSEEVRLYLQAGKLLDERMERLFDSFDGLFFERLQGVPLTTEQKLVLSYLMKSEWANRELNYTILLTRDNNHFDAIRSLEAAGLVSKHPHSSNIYPIFIVHRHLMNENYLPQLRTIFGPATDSLSPLDRDILGAVFRFNNYSLQKVATPKQTSLALWHAKERDAASIDEFNTFYRKVRGAFTRLAESQHMKKVSARGYELNTEYLHTHLL